MIRIAITAAAFNHRPTVGQWSAAFERTLRS
jgi:hypothetical protein